LLSPTWGTGRLAAAATPAMNTSPNPKYIARIVVIMPQYTAILMPVRKNLQSLAE
jgi:hypothetical protein